MSRTTFVTLCAVIGLLLSAGCATMSPQAGSGEIVVVQFDYDGLKPESVQIAPDGNVRWLNLAADSSGFVVFPTSISQSFSCGTDLKPYFTPIEGGYQSLAITSFEPRRVQLPCSLEPGTYGYEVWITGAGLGETTTSPQRKLSGTIVVE